MLLVDINELANKDKLSYREMHMALQDLYKLDYNPVAIKFFFDQEEYDKFEVEKVPGPKMTYCQVALASRMDDYITKFNQEKLLCGNAKTVFGMRESSDEEVDGHVKYTNNWELAKECLNAKPMLPLGELKGIATAPLYKATFEPDVVFMITDTFQAYHILNDYIGATKKPTLNFTHTINSAVCGGTVGCYQKQTIEMKTMCAGSFTSGKTEKGEINIFVPGTHIGALSKQLIDRTAKYGGSSMVGPGGQQYPGVDVCKKCPMIKFKEFEK
ncbi:protein of unknown function DUF169 [Desulforamulus reducens MI-1]|uniref:DUF169 domain-containing protein n=1 Tax=Desulforamulus reducens (strain ATCC BAA-1160 / DSM 100696 / MI-1) TaxID=349161 RepID=A4J3Z6_DESRM|nr:DUF169 domain-containing protein [Desulforamulus reducens]ABO49799.1 protein of unknown function DUF169 [Desulforamulus reducens MI-1]